MKLNTILDEVSEGSHIRVACPNCRSNNALSISHEYGVIQWFCFDANCKTRGRKRTIPSVEGLKLRLHEKAMEVKPFQVPQHWVMGITNKKCVNLLQKTNSLEPYRKGYFKVAFDPKQDRMVYLITNDVSIVGGIGRTLSNQSPKSLIYPGSQLIPLMAGKGKNLVLTEDCASACSISNFSDYTGSPLLGTNLKDEYIRHYMKYDKIIIALDRDAKKKAEKHKDYLTYHHNNVIVWNPPADFKDMTNVDIREFLDNQRGNL